jgi:transcriptional regulator with XRE-family HTH domain
MMNAPPQPWPSLKSAVRRSGLSYTELAKRVGISRQSVTAYARGDRHPSEETIAALAIELGVPYDELRADVPFATSPIEMFDEIDGLVSVLSVRLRDATTKLEEIKAMREQLHELAQVSA